jgi:hypothetical protein
MTMDIPPQITRPDSVETRIGTPKFFDGFRDDQGTHPIAADFPSNSHDEWFDGNRTKEERANEVTPRSF